MRKFHLQLYCKRTVGRRILLVTVLFFPFFCYVYFNLLHCSHSRQLTTGQAAFLMLRLNNSYQHNVDKELRPAIAERKIPGDYRDYVVRAWLPRRIHERFEALSGSLESNLPVRRKHYIKNYILIKTPRTHTLVSNKSLRLYFTDESRKENSYEKDTQKQIENFPKSRLPQALIIGVKKCGTRALLEFLRLHPNVRAPGPEIHFFDKNYHLGLEWYRQQMPLTLEDQLTIEKTPSYFVSKQVPIRVHKLSRDMKLLLVVRDPVTRAISDYTQTITKWPQTPSFKHMAFLNTSTGLLDTSWAAIRIGMYSHYLLSWNRFFPSRQIHVVSGENLIQDPGGEMAMVQDFLKLPRIVGSHHFYFNQTKGFPCVKKSENKGVPHCLGRTKGRTHPDISSETVDRLRDFYRPFNQKFYRMVGRDFMWL